MEAKVIRIPVQEEEKVLRNHRTFEPNYVKPFSPFEVILYYAN